MSQAMQAQVKAPPAIKPIALATQSGLLQRQCACGGSPGVDGECAECRAKRLSLQRHATNPAAPSSAVPPIVHDVLRSPGHSLDAGTRAFMEPRFGHDFSNVRVHTDARAVESARAVNALAYTVGRNVVFGTGQYSPGTSEGKRLMAHELTHVVQQGANMQRLPVDLETTRPTDSAEKEAQIAANAVLQGQVVTKTLKKATEIARQTSDAGTPLTATPSSPVSERKIDQPTNGAFFSGSQLIVYRDGKEVMQVAAKSGQTGHLEYEKDIGPIPDGTYTISPNITNSPVDRVQGGKCGANSIERGYQRLTSNQTSPCAGPPFSHYCNIPCVPPGATTSQMCFTPVSCWGNHRIRVEGSVQVQPSRTEIRGSGWVKLPAAGTVPRDGFYIHGGNPGDPVTSGCIKVINYSVFDELRKFKHPVPLVVKKGASPSAGVASPGP